jgi:hypothetical protein
VSPEIVLSEVEHHLFKVAPLHGEGRWFEPSVAHGAALRLGAIYAGTASLQVWGDANAYDAAARPHAQDLQLDFWVASRPTNAEP